MLYKEGFAYFNGEEVIPFRWHEISAITMQITQTRYYGIIPGGTEQNYTILSQSGAHIQLSSALARIGELFGQIRKHSLPHILARHKQEFDSGQNVQFGPLAINKFEIQEGKKSYA